MATPLDPDRIQAFAHQAIADQAAVFSGVLTYLGDRLGIYRAMADGLALTPDELAARTHLAERNLREWLAGQAAAGYLTYDPATGAYALPAEHAAVLIDDDSPAAVIGGFVAASAAWADADRIGEAFRTGHGLSWQERDERLFTGTERFYAAGYRANLVNHWLPALDGVVDKLRRGARVLDVGTGHGAPLLMMARAFPASTFVGVDYHPESVETARDRALDTGLADRVSFEVAPATGYGPGPGDGWDLICFFDVLHDLGDPVAAATLARERLAPGGTLLLVEPRAADQVADNLHPLGKLFYAASSVFCTPMAQAQPGAHGGPSVALGAQAGPARLEEVLAEAGFTRVRVPVGPDQAPVNLIVEARV